MTSGKSGEKVEIDGTYYDKENSSNEVYLKKNDEFPFENNTEKEITWILKENDEKKEESKDKASDSNLDNKTEKKIKWYNQEATHKKKGFFAAINSVKSPDEINFKLVEILKSEEVIFNEKINELDKIVENKKRILYDKYTDLLSDVEEKENVKKEYEEELKVIQEEYNKLNEEIKINYQELKEEIKNLGANKEGLVKKRIDEFELEVNKIIDVYQNIENSNNEKFRKDFNTKEISQSDKKFYYNYKEKLEEAFNTIQSRLRYHEKNGLNNTVAKFLIYSGWLTTFTTSWYFSLWYSGDDESNNNIIVHILDGIRLFTQKHGLLITIGVLLSYLIMIFLISKFCYNQALKNRFIQKPKKKKEKKESNEDNIEITIDKESLMKAQFRASSWYEMVLKILPMIAIILFLVMILAIDTQGSVYASMSNSNYIQFIGILLPISTTPIIYFYITKVIEPRFVVSATDSQNNQPKSRLNWEISSVFVCYIILIVLFIFYKNNTLGVEINQIGAWGFFIGSISTGLAMGYGYRYISLNESYNLLVDDLDFISKYIMRTFYPFEVSYLKSGAISFRMHKLYHSLIDLVESRNKLGVVVLNPHLKSNEVDKDNVDNEKKEDNIDNKKVKEEASKKETENNFISKVLNSIIKSFKTKHQKIKGILKWKDRKIKNLKDELKDAKRDNVDIEELTYFPEIGSKIKQYKSLIEKLEKKQAELKEELDGKYKNERIYASINQQIENIKSRINDLKNKQSEIEVEYNDEKTNLEKEFDAIKRLIEEGYNLGQWYAKNKAEML